MKELKRGAKNYDVIALQQLLNLIGAKTSVDGAFGPSTQEAVKLARYKLGLKSDVVATKEFFKELYEATNINTSGIKNFAYAGLTEDQYNPEFQKKDSIVLHHTAGSSNPYYVRDHFQKLAGKVATVYVIGGKSDKHAGDAYDGLCLQLFKHTSQWAYHINVRENFNVFGRSRFDGNAQNKKHGQKMEKRSIGIEVCNYGYLEYVDGGFWFMTKGKKRAKVAEKDVQEYQGKGYRGKRFYQKYTAKQIETLKDVIIKTANLYNMKLDLPRQGFDERWFDYSWEATRGDQNLYSHSSVRSKSDMHPQPELIEMLNSLE